MEGWEGKPMNRRTIRDLGREVWAMHAMLGWGDSGPVPAESFLGFAPSGPQAFARLYGTIQRGLATGLYVYGSDVGAVEKVGQSFRGPRRNTGKRQRGRVYGTVQSYPTKSAVAQSASVANCRARRGWPIGPLCSPSEYPLLLWRSSAVPPCHRRC